MFLGLLMISITDEKIGFSFKNEKVLHFLGVVGGAVEVDEFFKFAIVYSEAHGIIEIEIDYNWSGRLSEWSMICYGGKCKNWDYYLTLIIDK